MLLLVEQVTHVRCVITRIDELTQPLFLRSGSSFDPYLAETAQEGETEGRGGQ